MMKIVEYIRDRAGEEPFLLGEKKYQFVTALYPDGKEDIGVYVFGNDMVLDYEYWMDQNFISFEKGGSIADLEKKNPTLKASREHEKRDKDFEIFEVSVEADAMMEAEGAEALEAIEIPAMAEIGADGAEAAFERGGAIEYDWQKAPSTYTKLPYKLAKYFKRPKGSVRVTMDKLNPTSMVQAEVERAYEKMKGAFLGEIETRKPISLRKKRSKTGKITYDIIDGNSTYANAYLSGWTHLIGKVVEEVKEGKIPSLLEYARSIRKEGESWASARDRAKKTYDAEKFKDGGNVEVFVVDEGVKFNKEKYPSIFGDSDGDKLPNVDDPNPTKAGDKKSIEQVKLSDVFERLLNVKEGLDVRMEKVVDSMKKKSPQGSIIYARTKTPYSIVNKLVNKRLGTLTDMIGTTIEVEDQRGLESLRDRVERGEFGQVLDFDNYYESPKAGYRAYHFIVDTEGVPTEIQLKTRRQKQLNKLSHEPYKKEKLNAKRLDELSLLARRADEGDAQAIEDYEMLMKYPKAVEKQLTLP
jgi:ppGpp synthetase/RelA/SpoT-type nucleotidyltranferase